MDGGDGDGNTACDGKLGSGSDDLCSGCVMTEIRAVTAKVAAVRVVGVAVSCCMVRRLVVVIVVIKSCGEKDFDWIVAI